MGSPQETKIERHARPRVQREKNRSWGGKIEGPIGSRFEGRVQGPRACSVSPTVPPSLEKDCASVPSSAQRPRGSDPR